MTWYQNTIDVTPSLVEAQQSTYSYLLDMLSHLIEQILGILIVWIYSLLKLFLHNMIKVCYAKVNVFLFAPRSSVSRTSTTSLTLLHCLCALFLFHYFRRNIFSFEENIPISQHPCRRRNFLRMKPWRCIVDFLYRLPASSETTNMVL